MQKLVTPVAELVRVVANERLAIVLYCATHETMHN
jgi:hypothetical protein